MPDKAQIHYVGLDISKAKLDYCLSDTEEGHCANTSEGWGELIAKLKSLDHPRVVCEASGGYEKHIVNALLAAQIETCVVQPGRVRYFAKAEGLLAKNDPIDGRLLRRYGQKIEPRLAQLANPVLTVLRELLESRRLLIDQMVEAKGRLDLASPIMAKLLKRQLTLLEKQLKEIEQALAKHIKNDPDLRSKTGRLQEVQGIGQITAATALAYTPELGLVESAELSALIGVAPYAKDSGSSHGARHIFGGRAQVRNVLFMAATCAAQHNPVLRPFYERLNANGKPHKVCIVAVMRKLACVMNRLIQDPNFVLVS